MTTARTEARAPGGYRLVLATETFRRFWLALLFARVGEAIASVAMPLLVYRITGSAGLISLIFVVQMAPRVMLAPVAGLLADQLDRRRLLIGATAGRAIGVAILPLATEVWQIGLIAALVAVGTAIADPAQMAALPTTVEAPLLVPALSVTQVTGGVTRIVGPALGAGLVGAYGPNPAFWLQTACFLCSIVWLRRLRLPHPMPDWAGRGLLQTAWQEIATGLRTVWHTPVVRGISAAEALWSLIGAVLVIAGVVYTQETLKLGDRADLTFGLLTATMSAGAVLGALIAGRVERRIGRPFLMAIGYLGPLLLLPVGLVPPLPVLFGCWFALGFADAWAVIAMQAYLAEAVPSHLRGRVYATWSAVVMLASLGCFALIGWLTARLGAPATLALAGGVVGFGAPLLLVVTGALAAVRHASSTGAGPPGDSDHRRDVPAARERA